VQGNHENVIRFAPPLIITKDDIDWALERIEPVLKGHSPQRAPSTVPFVPFDIGQLIRISDVTHLSPLHAHLMVSLFFLLLISIPVGFVGALTGIGGASILVRS